MVIFMSLSQEQIDAIENENVVFLATSSNDVPNVVPIGFAKPLDADTILLVDNFMKKTRENLEKNPKAALVLRDASEAPYQIKGSVEILTEGKIFEEAVDWATSVMSQLAPKSAIVLKVEEIYSVQPGPTAGERID